MIDKTDKLYDLYQFFTSDNKDYLKNLAVDNVIFGYHEKELKVLLVNNPYTEPWMLPGGYIKKTEDVETAASRVALQRTGLRDLFLKQFKVFSTPGRNKDSHFTPALLSELTGKKIDKNHWLFDQIATVGFYTLVEFSKVDVDGSTHDEKVKWFDINHLPSLLHDHNKIIKEALQALRHHIYHYPIGYELLPEKFTLPDIRILYQTILGKEMDDRNFARKLTSLGIIEKLEEIKHTRGHRSPYLYSFNKEMYNQALDHGVFFS
ncbi:NUDIX domain-containing protein [Flavobacterium plurextorum]|uniref:NUDIX hydrolase n=1 Tax=Flavobacterium TaxID=237 RepID=UPI00214D14AA|nr:MULTISPECIES: NUDIX domain-containing protein [Flavobacterium]UUW08314.1 NUDIX domain-containing protein [Flavobacterium plurextorum]